MKKLMIALCGIVLIMSTATTTPLYATPNPSSGFRATLDPEQSLALAIHYAPIWHQDTDPDDLVGGSLSMNGTADYITNFDFDGDWIANNNWENLREETPLRAHIYYSVVETESHWFILYADFHPRDWGNICLTHESDPDCHENDMEGAILLIRKTPGTEYGEFHLMATQAHGQWPIYTSSDVIFEGTQPTLFVESGGHGVYAWDGSDFPGGDGVVYRYTNGIASEPFDFNDRDVDYALVSTDVLWSRRYCSAVGQVFYHDQGEGYLGLVFDANDYIQFTGRQAKPPWGWPNGGVGHVFLDPVSFSQDVFPDSLIGSNFSDIYVNNPYQNPASSGVCLGILPTTSVDVSLVIDSSGSMSSNDPSDMRKEGARVFVGTAQNGDEIAIVDFDSNADVLWHMTPLTPTRTAIYEAIDQIDSSGGTNIATGLQAGYTELQAGEHDTRVAVLMTDGQSPDPSSAVSQYIDAGWPIYTIGLGSGVNQQMLDQIAYSTGGLPYQLTDPNDLIRVYFEIVGAILGGTTIANQQNLIQQGQMVQATVAVPANQSQVTFLVNWPGSRVDTTLTTPSGQQITPQTVDPNVYHAQGLTYELYRITNPESGDWTVSMYGADLPPGGEMVELTVNAIGPTTVAPTANAGGPYTGLVGQPVLFDGSASNDPDGNITLYEWDFDSGGTFDFSSSDPTATHTYGAPYNGTVILQVTDNSGTTATGAASVTIEAVLVCNSAPEGFDAGARAVGWIVLTGVAGGPEWTDLSACGPYPNWTNGAGDAACISAGNIIVQPFDSELRTPMFSLVGYTEAYLNYQANYHNWASQDQLDLDISSDGGATWTTLRSWQEDHGAPFGLPGENVNVNLASYLGQSNLMARWRYYAPSGQGLGYYAQLDEVMLNCTEIPPTAVTVNEMTSATSQSPLSAASLPMAGLPAAAGLAFFAAAWLRRKR